MSKLLCMAALLAAGVGTPGAAAGQTPAGDAVDGEAIDCIEFVEEIPGRIDCSRMLALNIHVESGPAGENPIGTVSWSDMGQTPGSSSHVTAEATCLSLADHLAIVGISGTWHLIGIGADIPVAGLIRISDAGGPDSGADTVEFALEPGAENGPPLPGPTSCSAFPGPFPSGSSSFPDFSNEAGDLVVTDTRVLPSSKDQCKKGGWRTHEIFRNQGDCVSFVATGGKNPPAIP